MCAPGCQRGSGPPSGAVERQRDHVLIVGDDLDGRRRRAGCRGRRRGSGATLRMRAGQPEEPGDDGVGEADAAGRGETARMRSAARSREAVAKRHQRWAARAAGELAR